MTLDHPRTARKSTDTLSLRLDSSIHSILEEEARRKLINLNTLVSQIFTQYITWGRQAEKLKLLPTTKDLLRELFQLPQRNVVEEMGKRVGENSGAEQILFLFQRVDSDAVLRFLDLWGSHFDAYEHRAEGTRHFFTIHHDVNLNFSIFIRAYVTSILKSTLGRSVEFETISPNAVTFSFEASKAQPTSF